MKREIILILWIFLWFTGCATYVKKATIESSPIKISYEEFNENDFKAEMERLEKIIKNEPNVILRSQAHYLLGQILIHHKNSFRDYKRAFNEFNSCLELNPLYQKESAVLNLKQLLQTYLQCEESVATQKLSVLTLTNQSKTYKNKVENQEKTINEMKTEIEELKSVIQKLDSLYFNIEKKKKESE
jgi:TolA-binding protein